MEPVRLIDVLRALPERELGLLTTRLSMKLDPQKRLDPAGQVARALVARPELRDPSLLPSASRELLHRLAEARGRLVVPSLPPAVGPLVARGLVFARMAEQRGVELLFPAAFVVQLRTWESEDPRCFRALLSQASFESSSAIASHYLGRPATPPLPLALEAAYEAMCDRETLTQELEALPPAERRLLDAVLDEGGEVVTEELLDLEREPMRLRTAMGPTPSRRGAGFSLERRGFLVPVHPNRHLVPTEVSEILGGAATREREARRAAVRAAVRDGDYHPRRARFADDPAPLAIAMALSVREGASELRPSIGTPRSLSSRLSQRFGSEIDRVMMLAALSRAVGLWEASAASPASPPGNLSGLALSRELFNVWRRGGAWDEARESPELFRLPPEAREASPSGRIRELLLGALRELGEDRWVPWSAVARYVLDDEQIPGIARLMRRWAERAQVPPPETMALLRRLAFESLPLLGVLDLGDVDGDEDAMSVRLTPRGRALLGGSSKPQELGRSEFTSPETLDVGSGATVASVFALSTFVEVGRVEGGLTLLVTPQSIARGLAHGIEAETIRSRLAQLADLPPELSRQLEQAGVVLARAPYVACSGYLAIDDATTRELLRTRRQTADLFVDDSPPTGLLLAPGVDLDKVVARCRALGIEIVQAGQVLRTKSSFPPAAEVSERRRTGPRRHST